MFIGLVLSVCAFGQIRNANLTPAKPYKAIGEKNTIYYTTPPQVFSSGVVYAENETRYWSHPELYDNKKFNNGKLLLTFDDGKVTQYTNGLPLFKEKGVKATLYVRLNIQGAEYLTIDEADSLYKYGMDLQGHALSHSELIYLTNDSIIEELAITDSIFLANGFPLPEHLAYPSGLSDERVRTLVSTLKKTGRTVSGRYFNKKHDKFLLPSIALDNTDDTAMIYFKSYMDRAKADTLAMIFYGHDIGAGTGISVAYLEEIIDYADSIGLDIITISELYEQMKLYTQPNGLEVYAVSDTVDSLTWRSPILSVDGTILERSSDNGVTYVVLDTVYGNNKSYSDTTLITGTTYTYRAKSFKESYLSDHSDPAALTILGLTSSGTGAGISKLTLTINKRTTFILSGNARFYTNSGATVGESTTWTLNPGSSDVTRYIKNTSGVSYFKILNNSLSAILSWISSTNAPVLSGNISTLTNVSKLIGIVGSTSLSGDISKLVNLSYISIQGGNTISGSIEHLYDLTDIILTGNNTVSGDITNKTKLKNLSIYSTTSTISGSVTNLTNLTQISVNANSLSGSVAGLTNLTYLGARGTNTLTGSVANLTNLTYMDMYGGGNTLSGSVANLTRLTYLRNTGSGNTLTGSIEGLTDLTFLYVQGQNTLSGDLRVISSKLTSVYLAPCAITTYTSGADWSKLTTIGGLLVNPAVGSGLDASEVDLLIQEISATKVEGRAIAVTLRGSNAARTSASDAARNDIVADGGSVLTNP